MTPDLSPYTIRLPVYQAGLARAGGLLPPVYPTSW